MIVLFIVLWIVASFICAACLMHLEPSKLAYDDEARMLVLGMSLITWWLFLIIAIGYLILKVLAIIPTFMSGVLDGMKKEKEKK